MAPSPVAPPVVARSESPEEGWDEDQGSDTVVPDAPFVPPEGPEGILEIPLAPKRLSVQAMSHPTARPMQAQPLSSVMREEVWTIVRAAVEETLAPYLAGMRELESRLERLERAPTPQGGIAVAMPVGSPPPPAVSVQPGSPRAPTVVPVNMPPLPFPATAHKSPPPPAVAAKPAVPAAVTVMPIVAVSSVPTAPGSAPSVAAAPAPAPAPAAPPPPQVVTQVRAGASIPVPVSFSERPEARFVPVGSVSLVPRPSLTGFGPVIVSTAPPPIIDTSSVHLAKDDIVGFDGGRRKRNVRIFVVILLLVMTVLVVTATILSHLT